MILRFRRQLSRLPIPLLSRLTAGIPDLLLSRLPCLILRRLLNRLPYRLLSLLLNLFGADSAGRMTAEGTESDSLRNFIAALRTIHDKTSLC